MSLGKLTNILEIPSLGWLRNQVINDFWEGNLKKFKSSDLELLIQIPHPHLSLTTKEKINYKEYKIIGAYKDIMGYKVNAKSEVKKDNNDLYRVSIEYEFDEKNKLKIVFGLSP